MKYTFRSCQSLLGAACLILLGLGLPGLTLSQINVGIGYQMGFFKMDNADKTIDRFNGSGFLYNDMNRFRWPGGEIYAVSVRHERLLAELTMNTRRARASAESFSGPDLYRRDIRFSMQAFSFGVGYALVNTDRFVMYPAFSLDLGYMKLSTRYGQKASIGQAQYQLYDRHGLVALTAYFKMVFRQNPESITTWTLSPYFHYPLRKYDFFALNPILLRPSDWYLDGNTLLARPMSVGVALTFDLDLIRFLQ